MRAITCTPVSYSRIKWGILTLRKVRFVNSLNGNNIYVPMKTVCNVYLPQLVATFFCL